MGAEADQGALHLALALNELCGPGELRAVNRVEACAHKAESTSTAARPRERESRRASLRCVAALKASRGHAADAPLGCPTRITRDRARMVSTDPAPLALLSLAFWAIWVLWVPWMQWAPCAFTSTSRPCAAVTYVLFI
ncbi:unnamed protein product [Symbiodinium natans]|uniref:Uncharacterized protein n=1 Tax=Symbiodinium natans TaxID=878477 RepID=A0A812K8T3_9DINO|nr:unnamed protein product [Symbiodinium natans]